MIRSMTGFGRGEADGPGWHVQIDLRTFNHRFLDLRFRLPFYAPELELHLKDAIGSRVTRGKVDCTIEVHVREGGGGQLRVNRALVRDFLATLRELRDELAIPGEVRLDHIASLPWGQAFSAQELRVGEADFPIFDLALQKALDSLQKMREAEGSALADDLRARLAALRGLVDRVESASEGTLPYYRDRLRERIRALVADSPLDEERILQEAAMYAEKADVTEEITRLRSHRRRVEEALASKEAVGKKLDFLLQEMHREINTIGSKAKGPDLSDLVVEAKSINEAMREQVQNIE